MATTLEITTDDGTAEVYLTGSGPGVLFFIDAIGLRPRIEEMADRIADMGYTVLAPNVFYRMGTAEELRPPYDLRDPKNREDFIGVTRPRVQGYTPDLSNPDTERWLDVLAEHAPGPVGVTGYCMGARLSIRAAALRPDTVAAAGGFHGANLVDGTETSPNLLLPEAKAEFVFGHADHDAMNPPEAIERLGRDLDAAGLTASNEVYPDAQHGFTMSDTSAYQEAGTERMFAALEDLFGRTLRR